MAEIIGYVECSKCIGKIDDINPIGLDALNFYFYCNFCGAIIKASKT